MQRIDLDANATTPVLPEVLAAMLPVFSERWGNPSSAHAAGQRTRAAVEAARRAIAGLLQAQASEIVFTSGGTEADNLALTGVLQPWLDRGEPAHLVTSSVEHHAVLHAAEALARRGVEVTYLQPARNGALSPADLQTALRPHTRLVSIMLANNETGALQPVGKMARFTKAHGAIFHTDAVQAAGKLRLDMAGEFKHVDLLSLSGHKMYAPQGTGALFVRKGTPLAPLFHGGPHERQRRAGTENVPGIVGLGVAATAATAWLAGDGPDKLSALRDRLERTLCREIEGTSVNAGDVQRTVNTTNVSFRALEAERILAALDVAGVSASFGAACQSGATEPSHVLLAMGLTPAEARGSVRFSLSRFTTSEEIDEVLRIVPGVLSRMRSLAGERTAGALSSATPSR